MQNSEVIALPTFVIPHSHPSLLLSQTSSVYVFTLFVDYGLNSVGEVEVVSFLHSVGEGEVVLFLLLHVPYRFAHLLSKQ